MHKFIMSTETLWQRICQHHFKVDIGLHLSSSALYRSLAAIESRAHSTAATVYSASNTQLQSKLAATEKALHEAQLRVSVLMSTSPADASIMQDKEGLFHSMVQAKLQESGSVITAQGIRGCPITLMKVTVAEKTSDVASERTKQLRSQFLEQASHAVSGSKLLSSAAAVAQ